ncbi:MAG: hypothetical protein U0232_22430 [Thermomicrobiales bacterium]
MTATSSATCTPVAIGIVGLTPTLAESLRIVLRAGGYELGPVSDVPGDVALVTDLDSPDVVAPLPFSSWNTRMPRRGWSPSACRASGSPRHSRRNGCW